MHCCVPKLVDNVLGDMEWRMYRTEANYLPYSATVLRKRQTTKDSRFNLGSASLRTGQHGQKRTFFFIPCLVEALPPSANSRFLIRKEASHNESTCHYAFHFCTDCSRFYQAVSTLNKIYEWYSYPNDVRSFTLIENWQCFENVISFRFIANSLGLEFHWLYRGKLSILFQYNWFDRNFSSICEEKLE